ncbi:MAG TPA: lysylphosphatidylglycerol synthase transmembrane domain-containing protein [Limnochordales bacterium]
MSSRPPDSRLATGRLARAVGVTVAAGAAAVAGLAAAGGMGAGGPAWRALADLDPGYVAAALGLTVLAWWLRVVRSTVLVRALGAAVPPGRMFGHYLASVFVSHVTPTSTGGVPVFVYLLVREGLSPGRAAAVALLDSGLVAVWLVAAWPLARWWAGGSGGRVDGTGLMWALVAATGLAAALAAAAVAWPQGAMRALLALRRRLAGRPGAAGAGSKPRHGQWLRRRLRGAVRESLRLLWAVRFFVVRRPLALALAVVTTGLYWAVYLSIPWAVVRGLAGRASWPELAVRQVAFNLAQALIPTPGGSVGAELMMAYLLRGMVAPSRLAVAVAVWRLCTFYASLAVGFAAFVRVVGAGWGDGAGRGDGRAGAGGTGTGGRPAVGRSRQANRGPGRIPPGGERLGRAAAP